MTFLNTQIAERGSITMNKEGVYGLQVTRNVYPAGTEYATTAPEAVGKTAWWEFNKDWKDASAISTGTDGGTPLSVGTGAVPAGTVGAEYNHTFTAAGGAAPYTWSVSAGELPAGLALSATGVLSGTPTEEGIAEVTVRVEDKNKLFATRQVTLTVDA